MTKKVTTNEARAGRSDGHGMTILLVSLALAIAAWIGVSYYNDGLTTENQTPTQIQQ